MLGFFLSLGTLAWEYNKVTAADIQRAAKQYFDVNNRTVATLVPDAAPDDNDQPKSAEEKQ